LRPGEERKLSVGCRGNEPTPEEGAANRGEEWYEISTFRYQKPTQCYTLQINAKSRFPFLKEAPNHLETMAVSVWPLRIYKNY